MLPAHDSAAAGRHEYRGRLAPSPTGLLHLGHARTFWTAYQRAQAAGGTLLLRNEDLDTQRCQPHFAAAMLEDLAWLGIEWQEGPAAVAPHEDVGPFGPYAQSRRHAHYLRSFRTLLAAGHLFPCVCSRREIASLARAPHEAGAVSEEPIYPGTCRRVMDEVEIAAVLARLDATGEPVALNWRFRVPEKTTVAFTDNNLAYGLQRFTAGQHFGDFAVWRRDGVPSYQLACVADDSAMHISEAVRGADLLLSTARQILLGHALDVAMPEYFHCPLLTDAFGERLAKRTDSLSIRAMRKAGITSEALLLRTPE